MQDILIVFRRVPWLTIGAVALMIWAYTSRTDSYAWYAWDSRNPSGSSTYFTYVLAHKDMGHIVGNLVMFGLAGWYLEMTLGRIRVAALVTVLVVAQQRLEVALNWFDTNASDYRTGGVSSVVMGMTAAMAVAVVFHMARSDEEPREFMMPIHGIAFIIAPLILGINILGEVQGVAPSDMSVAWGSHTMGWILGLALCLVMCFGTIKQVATHWVRELPENMRQRKLSRQFRNEWNQRHRERRGVHTVPVD